jgi:4-hydroxybenzoate polyprenyltransferase
MSSADALGRPASAPPVWRAWLQLARVSNTPTVVSNTVAGAVLATVAAGVATVAVVAVAMALFYTAGMILNDVLDEEIDRSDRPERPLPSGQVTRRAAVIAVVALFVVGEVLLVVEDLAAAGAGLGLIALIVLYDAWHKGNALSPVLMAGCRALVYVIAALAVASSLPWELWGAAALLLLYVIGLTQVAKAEGGGLLGRWPVVAVLAPVVYFGVQLPSLWALLVLALFGAWVVWTLRILFVRRRVGPAVGRLIAGIALFDAAAVASVEGSAAAVAVCLAMFALTVALQTKIAGT